jgi:hypothetical protein
MMPRPTAAAGSTLALAKRRSTRRAQQGGAVVFIVSMTIGVLVSLGAFALISASTEIKSAGYERQALQTHYLSEYAMIAASEKLDPASGMNSTILGQMGVDPSGTAKGDYDALAPRHHCQSLATVPPGASAQSRGCKLLYEPELSLGWALSTPLRPSTFAVPGSLGPVALDGKFHVEITDLTFGTTDAGNGLPGGSGQQTPYCPVAVTVTTFGQVLPNYAAGNTAQTYGASSIEEGRGRVTSVINSPCQ